jgi:hypothetical protein
VCLREREREKDRERERERERERGKDLKDVWRWSSQKAVIVNIKHKYISSIKIRHLCKTNTFFKYNKNHS